MDEGILRALRAMYDQLRRRLMVNGAIGDAFKSLTALLQGCALSCLLLNATATVWADDIDANTDAKPRGLIDDWYVHASERTIAAKNAGERHSPAANIFHSGAPPNLKSSA